MERLHVNSPELGPREEGNLLRDDQASVEGRDLRRHVDLHAGSDHTQQGIPAHRNLESSTTDQNGRSFHWGTSVQGLRDHHEERDDERE